jgi:hypothetical protein
MLDELVGRPLVRALAEEEAITVGAVGEPSPTEPLSRAGSPPA